MTSEQINRNFMKNLRDLGLERLGWTHFDDCVLVLLMESSFGGVGAEQFFMKERERWWTFNAKKLTNEDATVVIFKKRTTVTLCWYEELEESILFSNEVLSLNS